MQLLKVKLWSIVPMTLQCHILSLRATEELALSEAEGERSNLNLV